MGVPALGTFHQKQMYLSSKSVICIREVICDNHGKLCIICNIDGYHFRTYAPIIMYNVLLYFFEVQKKYHLF